MSEVAVVTARIGEELSAALDKLAADRDRSRAWLIEKAIVGFVADEATLWKDIQAADAAIDCDEFTAYERLTTGSTVEAGKRRPV